MSAITKVFKNYAQLLNVLFFITLVLLNWYLCKQFVVLLAHFLSEKCASLSSYSEYQNLISGLVCGTRLADNHVSNTLKTFALTHLIVVSGSHFIVLENLLRLFHLSRWSLPICWSFNLITGFQAPGTRAVIELSIRYLLKRHALFYPKELTVLASWILCIVLFPEWISSFSLFLSTLCAWILSIRLSGFSKLSENFVRFGFLYFVFSWCFFDMDLSLGIWCINQLVSLAISVILFPLALLAWCFPWAAQIFDLLWDMTFRLLNLTDHDFPAMKPFVFSLPSILRIFILVIFIFVLKIWNPYQRGQRWN